MVIRPVRSAARSQAPRVTGAVVFLMLGGLAGCGLRSSDVDPTYVESLPDKETYLLSQLDVRFENPDAHCELGRLYASQKDWKKAAYHFDTALGFDPTHRRTQASMIKMLLDRGDRAAADETLARYQRQLVTAPLEIVKLAMALAKDHLDTYAVSCFDRALTLAPLSAEVNKQAGLYYLDADNADKARNYLTKSFQLDPNQPEVAGALGRLGVPVEVPVKYQAQTEAGQDSEAQSGT